MAADGMKLDALCQCVACRQIREVSMPIWDLEEQRRAEASADRWIQWVLVGVLAVALAVLACIGWLRS